MDKKQIIEVVKKRKTPIIIVTLALLAVIAFAFLFGSVERQGKEQQALSLEEQEQLTDMTTYLDEIDSVVVANQERLAEATLFQSDTEQILNTFKESLSVLEKDLTEIETIINNHTEIENTANNEITASLTALAISQQEIKTQINTVNSSITAILSEIKAENESNFDTTFEKLEKLQSDLEQTQKDAKNYYDSLTELITLLQEENNAQFEELTNTLLTAQADLTELLENSFEAVQLKLDEDFMALMEKLDNLHEQIMDTTVSITDLLTLMEEADESRQEEIKAACVKRLMKKKSMKK